MPVSTSLTDLMQPSLLKNIDLKPPEYIPCEPILLHGPQHEDPYLALLATSGLMQKIARCSPKLP